jgi:hypothetical protein
MYRGAVKPTFQVFPSLLSNNEASEALLTTSLPRSRARRPADIISGRISVLFSPLTRRCKISNFLSEQRSENLACEVLVQ